MKLPLFTAISLALVLSACGDGKQNQDKRDANKQDRQDHHTDHDHSNDDQKKTPSKTKKPKTDPGTRSGSDDAVPDGVQVEPDAGEALVGSWMSACLDLDENSNTPLEERESIASKVIFNNDGSFKLFAYKFEKTHDCAGMDFTSKKFKYLSRVKGTYQAGDKLTTPEGAMELDYTVGEIAMAPMTGGAKLKLNGGHGFCGTASKPTEWEKPDVDGTPHYNNITGLKGCKIDDDLDPIDMLAEGTVIEDIFKVLGDKLKLGLDYSDDMSIEIERPTVFNDYEYTKVVTE
jgi:hypothetical protein